MSDNQPFFFFFHTGRGNVGINDLSEKNTDLTDSTQISTCSWTKGLSAMIELNMHTLLRQTSVHAIAETLLLLKLIYFFYISPSYGMLLKTTQWCLFHHTEATWTFFLSPTFVLPRTFLCHLLQQLQIS